MEFKPYNPAEIEPKWQKHWDDNQTFAATNDYSKPKFYGLIEFPYPSGNGLHVGHPRSNTAMDIISRKRRMEGYNVLFPIGWDAFGLPTENYAIKHNIHPAIVTKQNVDHFRQQLKRLGFSFDYSREVDTTDPDYYKWTQWIFLQMFKKGLAYKTTMPINWCTSCKVGLANEEVVGGAVPKNYFPAVEKGLRESMEHGPLAGYPVTGLKAVLYDGSYHDVDSNELSFKMAAAIAYKEGLKNAKPVLLEPVYSLKISVPADYLGDVMGDINKRRGRIMGTDNEGDTSIITAEVPLAEIKTYTMELRSLTRGSGKFVSEFLGYEDVPPMMVDKIIAEAQTKE